MSSKRILTSLRRNKWVNIYEDEMYVIHVSIMMSKILVDFVLQKQTTLLHSVNELRKILAPLPLSRLSVH